MEFLFSIALLAGATAGLGPVVDAVKRRRMRTVGLVVRRMLSSEAYDLVPVTVDDSRGVARLQRDAAHQQLLTLGFRVAGDRREVFGDPEANEYSVVLRYFISPTGTMVARFSSRGRGVSIDSWTNAGVFTTSIGSIGFFALPPSHRSQQLPPMSLRDLVARHEKWLRHVAATTDRDLVSVGTIDEIVERTKASHAQVVTWRNSHSDDELLRKDMEGILGAGSETRGGARLLRALTSKPPEARLRTNASTRRGPGMR